MGLDMKTTRWMNAGVLLVTFVLIGCGGDSAPPSPPETLVPVSGTVKFDGQPAKGIEVTFVPSGATKGYSSSGVTDDAGKYKLQSLMSKKPGVAVGTCVVLFSKMDKPFSKDRPGEIPVNIIPSAWRETAEAGEHNTVTVPAAGGTFDFSVPKE
jgi:hypothetical protein